MSKIITTVLKYMWMIRVKKDNTHTFNIYNPVGYLVLVVYLLVASVITVVTEFFKSLVRTFVDSVEREYEWTVVIWMVALLTTLCVWLL